MSSAQLTSWLRSHLPLLDRGLIAAYSKCDIRSALQSSPSAQEPKLLSLMLPHCHRRIALAFLLIVLGLAGCGPRSSTSGFPNPSSFSTSVSVNPSSSIVAAGSTSLFTVMYAPSAPADGSLTWSVIPATGGTITSAGVYTASGTSGIYAVVATWTPSNAAAGIIISGLATVDVIPAPQVGEMLDPNFIQASGANQVSGMVQNGAIAGQLIPSVTSTDPSGNVQTRSGLNVPVACTSSATNCP